MEKRCAQFIANQCTNALLIPVHVWQYAYRFFAASLVTFLCIFCAGMALAFEIKS